MSDPLLYQYIGDRADKVIEECTELIQAICKAKRFGYFEHHPNRPSHHTSIDDIRKEMEDVNQAMELLEAKLREMCYEHYKNPR